MTILLDTHALHWMSAEPRRLSDVAADAVREADELAVAGVTWYELARLAELGRIVVGVPVLTWLGGLSQGVRTVGVTPSIAASAAAFRHPFPGDPIDRIIYATAIEHGWQIVTKDRGMHDYPQARCVTVW